MSWTFISIPKTGTVSVRNALNINTENNHVAIKKIANPGFTFAFVRNIFDHTVSWYQYHNKANKNLEIYQQPFRDWVLQGCPTHWEEDEGLLEYRGITDPLNQYEYITDHTGKILVNFVGRFEYLQRDLEHVISMLKIPAKPLQRLNSVTRRHYSTYYTSQDVVDKVLELRQKDFELLGYNKKVI